VATNWNKVGALTGLGCLTLAAATFAIQIWPYPQLKGTPAAIIVSGPKLIAVFILLGFVFSAFALLRSRASASKSGEGDWRQKFMHPTWEFITGHSFTNQTVEVDGKSFRECKFENVTLLFHGKAAFDFVGTNQILGSLSLNSDNPAVNMYSKLRSFAQSIPGAKLLESAVDEKGNPIPDGFKMSPLLNSVEKERFLESDPRVYLCKIDLGADIVQGNAFILENRGGSVAHDVRINTIRFGYSEITFETLDNIPINKSAKFTPTVESNEIGKHYILNVMEEAWDRNSNSTFKPLPFTVSIEYTDFRGDRKLETVVEVNFSYPNLSFSRNHSGSKSDEIFAISSTRFTVKK
jgi:hypothetical protein